MNEAEHGKATLLSVPSSYISPTLFLTDFSLLSAYFSLKMAVNTSDSYATPPGSDADGEDITKTSNDSLGSSAETQTPTYNHMFITGDEPLPKREDALSLICAGEKKSEIIDNVGMVFTPEKDDEVAAILASTTFETYYTVKAGKKGGYGKTSYLKDLDEEANVAAEMWRIAHAEEMDAQFALEKCKDEPNNALKAVHKLNLAHTAQSTLRKIRYAADLNLGFHKKKAALLMKTRKAEEAMAVAKAFEQRVAERQDRVVVDREAKAKRARDHVGRSHGRTKRQRTSLFD